MAARSWRWMRTRILGLLAKDTRLARHFTATSDVDALDTRQEVT